MRMYPWNWWFLVARKNKFPLGGRNWLDAQKDQTIWDGLGLCHWWALSRSRVRWHRSLLPSKCIGKCGKRLSTSVEQGYWGEVLELKESGIWIFMPCHPMLHAILPIQSLETPPGPGRHHLQPANGSWTWNGSNQRATVGKCWKPDTLR